MRYFLEGLSGIVKKCIDFVKGVLSRNFHLLQEMLIKTISNRDK